MKNRAEGTNGKDFINNMVRHMNEKYPDDTFTYKGPFGGGAGADTKNIVVSSKNYPGKEIYVRHSAADDVFTDNYLGVKYAEQTQMAIKAALDTVITQEYLLIYEVDRFACPNTAGTLSFEEYAASKAACIGFTVVAGGAVSDKATFEKEIEAAITKAGICCSATIYFDNGSGAFDTLKPEGLSQYTFKKLYSDAFSFKMDSNEAFSSSYWGD
jgi:hypothetical protein